MYLNLNTRIFLHVDVKSMYVSCELIERPDLWGRPVVALSNNNGCIIAQNDEAKAILEIYMCRPWFEVQNQAKKLGVTHFASHYELYAHHSSKFVETLKQFAPRVEIYSIDECFLDMTGMNVNFNDYGHVIKNTVFKWTRLPVRVGFGHTKTLAKLANDCAKKQARFNGVCDLTTMSKSDLDDLMRSLPVKKVWGVGDKLAEHLNSLGVDNVLRLKNASPKRIRDRFGVVLERTVKELNGESWLEFEEDQPQAKQVMSSRSFGVRIDNYSAMQEAITFHASNAAQRMRSKKLFTQAVYIFIQNSPYDQAEYCDPDLQVRLPSPTDCSIKITNAALWLLKKIYVPGVYYLKAGVMLMDLVPKGGQQRDLFSYSKNDVKESKLMSTLDEVNRKYGRGTLKLASEGLNKSWAMRRDFKSPNYIGDWNELPIIGQDNNIYTAKQLQEPFQFLLH
jgi:DNA polymerase V